MVKHVCLSCNSKFPFPYSWTIFSIAKNQTVICPSCQENLERLTGNLCGKCSRSLLNIEDSFIQDGVCHDCLRWEMNQRWRGVLERNISLYSYNDFLKELLARYKYRGDVAVATIFTEDMKEIISNLSIDYIVPIPLSDERLLERGFNQSEVLIRNASINPTLLLKRVHTEKQSKKSREERIHIPQVFMANNDEKLTGKSVLLVDDIYTTGSTLRHAAEILQQLGASQIISLTIAR